MLCPQMPEALDSLELEFQALVSHLTWVLELNVGPLQKQHMLLPAEPSL